MQKTGEYNSNNAFIYNGNTGNVNNNKYNTNAVRPVSEFQGNVDPFASFYKSMRAAYRLCLKNKAHTANAIRFWLDEESELVALAREVFNCEYVPRQSIAFIVTKPCLREVVAADFRDRIVQHYIVMRLEALFEECGTLDDNMFSCRVGKGNLAAMPYIRNYFAAERGLTMHPRKFYLQHYSKGIKFLGAVIKYNRVYTNNQTVARCFGKIHYYNEACRHSSRRKARHVEKLATILNSYLGLMRHFDTFNIRKRIAAEVGTVWCDYIRFDDDITTATVVKHFRQREICKYNVRKQRRRDLFTLKNLLNDGNTAAN